jgi:hypothetical protein
MASDSSTATTRATNGASAAVRLPRSAPEVADDRRRIEECGERREIGARAVELRAHAVPLAGGRREERLRRGASFLEHAFGAQEILLGGWRGAHLVSHELPEPARRRIERRPRHHVAPAGALGTRLNPALVGQGLEVPAHGALRQLQRRAQLAHGELVPVEQQQQPAPGGVGERAEAVEDWA